MGEYGPRINFRIVIRNHGNRIQRYCLSSIIYRDISPENTSIKYTTEMFTWEDSRTVKVQRYSDDDKNESMSQLTLNPLMQDVDEVDICFLPSRFNGKTLSAYIPTVLFYERNRFDV